MASARRGAAAGAVKAEPRAAAESPGPEPRDEAEADVIQQAAADADEQLGTLFTGMGAWFHANSDRTVVTFWTRYGGALEPFETASLLFVRDDDDGQTLVDETPDVYFFVDTYVSDCIKTQRRLPLGSYTFPTTAARAALLEADQSGRLPPRFGEQAEQNRHGKKLEHVKRPRIDPAAFHASAAAVLGEPAPSAPAPAPAAAPAAAAPAAAAAPPAPAAKAATAPASGAAAAPAAAASASGVGTVAPTPAAATTTGDAAKRPRYGGSDIRAMPMLPSIVWNDWVDFRPPAFGYQVIPRS